MKNNILIMACIFLSICMVILAYRLEKETKKNNIINKAWITELDNRGLINKNKHGSFNWKEKHE